MTHRKEALNSKTNILLTRTKHAKKTTCWYCHLNGYAILDKWGCCKRCGTNLKKWSHRGKLIYPSLNDEKLAREVLGTRERCDIPVEVSHTAQDYPLGGDRHAGKVNHCQICWQKTIIFIWSTSRVIDKEKLRQIEQFKNVVNLERNGYPICLACIKELNLKEVKENGA